MADRNCRRCKATGLVTLAGGHEAYCAPCGGTGRVPDAATIHANKAAFARRLALINALRDHLRATVTADLRTALGEVDDGIALLEQREPCRLPKMLDSIEAGRLDDTAAALRSYFHEHATTEGACR